MTDKITVREAARRCGRNPETIRRWIWDGKLAAEKIGNQLFVEPNHVTALVGARSKSLKDGDGVAPGRAESSAEFWLGTGLTVPGALGPEDRAAVDHVPVEDAGWVYEDGGVWQPSSPESIAEQLAVLDEIARLGEDIRRRRGRDLEDIDWVEWGRDERMAEILGESRPEPSLE